MSFTTSRRLATVSGRKLASTNGNVRVMWAVHLRADLS
jgi:hypothetical protein